MVGCGIMRIEQLEYFVETSRATSLSKAGERLHITQQSLNAALKKLEEELGVTLLNRDFSGIQLTEQGRIALQYTEKILEQVENMKEALAISMQRTVAEPVLTGSLMIYSTAAANHALIPEAIQQIMNGQEQVSFVLLEKNKTEILQEIKDKQPCLGIVSHIPEIENTLELLQGYGAVYQKIADAKIYAVVAHTHPLAQQKSVTIKTLLKYPIGFFQPDYRPFALQKVLESKGKPRVQLITSNTQTYQRTVDSGQIVGFNVRMNFRNSLGMRQGNSYLPIRDFPNVELYWAANEEYYQAQKLLIEALVEQMKEILS